MSNQYDSAFRPVMWLALAVILLGFAWKFWYIALPVVVVLLGLFVWFWLRNRRRHISA